ncbi:transcriptional regulator [Bordetella ansorpii]|uniref:Transcriptional regulator n=1 Tax=Bordetella ansorpii TaxID=288768 RepID=A0A157QXD3_9BORD|nr:transcriptional regulator [Bordetella ansorpii]
MNHQSILPPRSNCCVKSNFSDRLKEARLLRGYTQQALARASGLSQSAIASYESGDRGSSRSVRSLAQALDVEIEWLETGNGPMERAVLVYEPGGRGADRHSLREPQPVVWPFSVDPRRFGALHPEQLQFLDQLLETYLDACQRGAKPPKGAKRRV